MTQTLGEGAYGKVKLGVQLESKEKVAVKIIERTRIQDKEVRKEVCIHKMLRHVNVTKFIAVAQSPSAWFMILELAPGGELYDRIGAYQPRWQCVHVHRPLSLWGVEVRVRASARVCYPTCCSRGISCVPMAS